MCYVRITRHKNKLKQAIAMSSNRAQAAVKAEAVHKQNIQRSLEHRLQVARATGNEQLIRQLEVEMACYG